MEIFDFLFFFRHFVLTLVGSGYLSNTRRALFCFTLFFFFFLTLDVLVGFVALVVSFFWLGGRRRKSVVALIGLRFQAAASQLSASHFRQLRRFEIEETIKEHCVFLRLGSGDERHREGKKGRRL